MDRASQQPSRLKLCGQLFMTFTKIAPTTFGGGYAILPVLDREVVEHHQWLNEDEMNEITALAGAAPGGIGVNAAGLIGYRIGGLPGLVASIIGISLPTILIMLIICLGVAKYSSQPLVQAALTGIKPAVIALIAFAAIRMGRRTLKEAFAWIAMSVCALLLLFTPIHPILVLVLGTLAGLVVEWLRMRMTMPPKSQGHNVQQSSHHS
ncbi:chromate transporter [Paenibacillus sp. 1001270B_150601_E10]|uniref:chromate transporter n=1 Tax=Paenibacillus sp. 1001270B_150601_E10 TaxID=2787079 RepID=UPI002B4BAF62|nr:chromate transporter [Paenibacillus sp. 1001270B_150601_E10]